MAQKIVMPSMGMYTEEGTLTAWLRPTGTRVEAGEAVAEITTEKVTFEVPSSTAGVLHHVAAIGANLRVEQLLGYILAEGEKAPAEDATCSADQRNRPGAASQPKQDFPADTPVRVSPAARKLARQHGIDLSGLRGSGPGGRIVEADILAKISK